MQNGQKIPSNQLRRKSPKTDGDSENFSKPYYSKKKGREQKDCLSILTLTEVLKKCNYNNRWNLKWHVSLRKLPRLSFPTLLVFDGTLIRFIVDPRGQRSNPDEIDDCWLFGKGYVFFFRPWDEGIYFWYRLLLFSWLSSVWAFIVFVGVASLENFESLYSSFP